MTPLNVRLATAGGWAVVALLAWVALAAELAPVGAAFGAAPAPDALFCVAAAVAARRPRLAPPALVFALGLTRDLLSGAPLGLGALALTLAVEAVRTRRPTIGRRGLALEWPLAAFFFALALAGQSAALWASLSPAPSFAELAARYALTVLAYPIVVLAVAWPLRLRPAGREAGT